MMRKVVDYQRTGPGGQSKKGTIVRNKTVPPICAALARDLGVGTFTSLLPIAL